MLPAHWVPLTAFTATLVICWWLLSSRFALTVLDHPNERSLHQNPVPRTGGIGIHAGILLAWLILAPAMAPIAWICLVVLLALSFVDDMRGMPVALRFCVHLGAALVLSYLVLGTQRSWWIAPLVALAVTWMINLYNFMDGSDGLAGGMTLCGFGAYGIAAWFAGSTDFALLNFSVCAAAAAFLIFNFHPARIFMGDAGAVPLGYLAAAFGLIGWVAGDWAWWFPLLVFSPFVVDASVTLARRLFRGERVWQAHRDHYYQRLVQMGWGHHRTALAEYMLMGICGIAALGGLQWPPAAQMALLAAVALAYAAIIVAVEIAWRRFHAAQDHEA